MNLYPERIASFSRCGGRTGLWSLTKATTQEQRLSYLVELEASLG
jgi:hypothetical protein